LQRLEREIGRLVGHPQTAGLEGVDEALAGPQEQRRFAERECTRIEERVAVLRLLRDTAAECFKERREYYYAPRVAICGRSSTISLRARTSSAVTALRFCDDGIN
jgi:hypothetical protein